MPSLGDMAFWICQDAPDVDQTFPQRLSVYGDLKPESVNRADLGLKEVPLEVAISELPSVDRRVVASRHERKLHPTGDLDRELISLIEHMGAGAE